MGPAAESVETDMLWTCQDGECGPRPVLKGIHSLEWGGTSVGPVRIDALTLRHSHGVVEHVVTDEHGHEIVRKIPGKLSWENVDFYVNAADDVSDTMLAWRDDVVSGNIADARMYVKFVGLDEDSNVLFEWNLANAWPSAVSTALSADGNELYYRFSIVNEGLWAQ
jgi:phage tail-like protein